jgi:hypothetical protein
MQRQYCVYRHTRWVHLDLLEMIDEDRACVQAGFDELVDVLLRAGHRKPSYEDIHA